MNSTTEIDSQKLESLFHLYYDGLCRYAFTIVKDQAEAKVDCISIYKQQAFKEEINSVLTY